MQKFLVLGLGNPGSRYKGTRHNVGFLFLESLGLSFQECVSQGGPSYSWAQKLFCQDRVLLRFVKPLSYMNLSGEVIPLIRRYFEFDELLVISDNVDTPSGTWRLRYKQSATQHNGIRSVVAHYSRPFWRLFVGVGPHQTKESGAYHFQDLSTYILGHFSPEELLLIQQRAALLPTLLEKLFCESSNAALNYAHSV